MSSPAWATRPKPARSRSSISTDARTRRPPPCPTTLIEDTALIGPKEKIRDDLEGWRESIATTLLVSGDVKTLQLIAELAL